MCETVTKKLSTKEAARVLGVSESSVKRWIDGGVIKAEKTPGGHRRISVTELDLFVRSRGHKVADVEPLGIDSDIDIENFSDTFGRYTEALRMGDAFALEGIVRLFLISGERLESVIDRLCYPAFLQVRGQCQHPSDECLVLHRAIEVTRRIISNQIAGFSRASEEQRPVMIFADVGYEVDGLPTYLGELSVAGLIATVQLGVNVAEEVIRGAVDQKKCHAVFLSASGPIENRHSVQTLVGNLTELCERRQVPCFGFGDFFREEDSQFAALRTVSNFCSLREQAKSLR